MGYYTASYPSGDVKPLRYERTTAPSGAVITTAEAKTHLRVTHSSDDTYIDALIAVASEHIERYANRPLLTQSWTAYYPCWPRSDKTFALKRPPVTAITSLDYYNSDGTQVNVSSANYIAELNGRVNSVQMKDSFGLPTLDDDRQNPISIEFVCGYASASAVPDTFKHAIKLLVSEWYCARMATSQAAKNEIPFGVTALLNTWRVKNI